MASPSELSLDCKPHSYSMLLKSFGDQPLQPSSDQNQTHKLEDFLARLEEERLKIDAFKRELPLCMQLLTNGIAIFNILLLNESLAFLVISAVETSRQQLQAYRGSNHQGVRHAVLEEFIPLKLSSSETSEKVTSFSDKTTWMTSAQLWSQSSDVITKQQSSPTDKDHQNDIGFNCVSPKLALDNKQRNGGAFLPFSKERNLSSSCSPNQTIRALPDLALNNSADHKDMEDRRQCSEKGNNGGGIVIDQGKGTAGNSSEGQATVNNNTNSSNTSSQTHRKARRCWSPDLHRRFVNALQMLGGSQVATPKQIRELMKVDGLTNDEVKSHLQKYRLHTRRPSPSPQAAGGPGPQLVVLGGIWVPPEYATAAHHTGAPTLYAAAAAHHHPSSHFQVPQDHFYTTAAATVTQAPPPPQQQLHHHTLHHQLHVYKATSQTHSSPESDLRGAGDRSESIEDGKSESSSWKGESGGENGERKGLAALREDGEESNGSDITLKF